MAAHLRGVKTVLADADPQRSASEVLKSRTGCGPTRAETSGPKLFALKETAQRAGHELMVIDTPCTPEQEVGAAIAVADMVLVIVRPTFLDIAAAVRTIDTARRLARPAQIVINQAFSPRSGQEPRSVTKALEALRFTSLPVSPAIVRSRAVLQSALASGRSAEEYGDSPAAREIAELWGHVRDGVFDKPRRLRA
jgi:chromosome partitioning protein